MRNSRGRGKWGKSGDRRGRGRGRGGGGGGRGRTEYSGNRDQSQFHKKQSSSELSIRLTEEQCGITQYISSTPGFTGIIKCRYSDFQVNEIDRSNQVVKLTDLQVPTVKIDPAVDDEDLLLNQYNLEILPLEIWDKISSLAMSKENEPNQPIEIDVTDKTKEDRTKIHNAIKKSFKTAIVSSTKSADDKKYIVFTKYDKRAVKDVRKSWDWPGDYVHFVLYKEDCDTMQAVMLLRNALNLNYVKTSFFGYAGTKDRRAKTSQWFSIKKIQPAHLVKAASSLRNIIIGNFKFENYHLKLGDLNGNRFHIALRNVCASEKVIAEAVDSLKTRGFINYYGLQRFGTRSNVPTFNIGKCLLRGNFQEAINLILDPHGSLYEVLKIYRETNDPQRAIDICPKNRCDSNSIEMVLLCALNNLGTTNYVGALNKTPRNVRLLYLHSYQSFIWNKCVSERIRLYGPTCCVGDLVPLNREEFTEKFDDLENHDGLEDDEHVNEDDLIQNDQSLNEKCESNSNNKTNNSAEVKVLTQEDIDSKKYDIYDVVMPLPGYKIQYPPNMKEYYKSLLEADGLKLELNHKIRSYSLSGAYRKMMLKPQDFNWKLVEYTNPYCDFILSDIDKIYDKPQTENVPDGKYKALILEFNLLPSTYATMVLRELLKTNTSADSQAAQNDYHKETPTNETDSVSINDKLEVLKSELDAESKEELVENLKEEFVENLKEELVENLKEELVEEFSNQEKRLSDTTEEAICPVKRFKVE